MILLFLFALQPRIEIVSASDTSVTYREQVPVRVPIDPAKGTYRLALNGNYATRTEARAPRDRHVISVLFLGNSLTYFNGMPRITSRIASREARPLLVDFVTQSGADLEDLWYRTDALKRIWQSHWDYVILQERSGRAAMDRGEAFHRDLQMFADQARRSGATPVLFMTWYPGNEAFFRAAAKRANVVLMPVGLAWKQEFDWDGTHPNLFGSYLVACTAYSLIYNKPALGAPFEFRDLAVRNEFYDKPLVEQSLNPETARAIQLAAWNAVKNR